MSGETRGPRARHRTAEPPAPAHPVLSFSTARWVTLEELARGEAAPRPAEGATVCVIGRVAAYDAKKQRLTLVDPDADSDSRGPPVLNGVLVSLEHLKSHFFGRGDALVQVAGDVPPASLKRAEHLVARSVTAVHDEDYPALKEELSARRAWFRDVFERDV